MKKLQINIFDTDLVWLGMIEEVESLMLRSSWHEIVYSEMRVNRYVQGIEELKVGRVLVINNELDKACIIEEMESSLEDNFWNLTLIPLKGILNYRIVHPTDSANGGAWLARYQSSVMKWIAYDNLMKQTRDEDRKFWNSDRTKSMLQYAGTKSFGETIDFTPDWNTGLMGDTITSIAKMSPIPLGWNIYITEDFSAYEMDVYEAKEKHINQTILPPVIFSEEFGNIIDATYSESIKEWRNVGYTKWNDGTNDNVNKFVLTDNGETQGFNRKEVLLTTEQNTSTGVGNDSYSQLRARPKVKSFTAEILNNPNTLSTYGEHWDLGDIVTIQSKAIKEGQVVSIDTQITQIEETYEQGEYNINATFGEGKLTLIQLIKNEIRK